MTAITDPQLLKLRDLVYAPKGEQTQWAHEFEAVLRAVQDDLTELAETVVRYETTAAGEQLLTDLAADKPDPVEQPPPAASASVPCSPFPVPSPADEAEIDRLRRLLQIEQDARRKADDYIRFAHAAIALARAIHRADDGEYWLPCDYLSNQFSSLAALAESLGLDPE